MKGCLGFDLHCFLLASEHLQVLMRSASDDVTRVLQVQLHLCELLFRFAHYFLTRYMATYFFRMHYLSPAFVVAVAEFSRLARFMYDRLLSDFTSSLHKRDRKMAISRIRSLERLRTMVALDCHLPRVVGHWQHILVIMMGMPGVLARLPGATVPNTPLLIAFGAMMVPTGFLGIVRVFQTSSKLPTRGLVRSVVVLLTLSFIVMYANALYLWWKQLPTPLYDPWGITMKMAVLAGGFIVVLPLIVHGRMAFYDARLYVAVEKWGKQDPRVKRS